MGLTSAAGAAPATNDRSAAVVARGCQVAFTAMSAKVALGYVGLTRSSGATAGKQLTEMRQALRTLVRGALLTEAAFSASGMSESSVDAEAQAISSRVQANLQGSDAKMCQTMFALLDATMQSSLPAAKVAAFESHVDATLEQAIAVTANYSRAK